MEQIMQAEQLNVTIKPLKPILTNSAQKELQVLHSISIYISNPLGKF
jgi:hypothetical protein